LSTGVRRVFPKVDVKRRDYAGKTVIVTGAAGGLGQALCRAFAAEKAKIVAVDRDLAAVEAFARDLAPSCPDVLALACDVTDMAACQAAMDQVLAKFGGADVLVNNAGISHRSYFSETDVSVIRRVMDVNFFGSIHWTKVALPSLLQRRGQVIVISSIAGFSPLLERTGYSASKHALHGFFDSLRAEVEEAGVDVMLVSPAFITTGIEANALSGDGGAVKAGRKVVGKETSPDAMAGWILNASAARSRFFLPTLLPKLSWWVSRLAPGFFARQMKRRVRVDADAPISSDDQVIQ
jgi:NAD(P)-dependent dehydrogenase (short-subunit alcohol dehydrogenase family)